MNTPKPYQGDQPYIFISYPHKDFDVILPIIAVLQENGYRVWFDEGIDPGTEWATNIAAHIRQCAVFIAMISPNYLLSRNCCNEVNFALDLDKPLLLLYTAPASLPDGMAMQLGRLQAIHYHRYHHIADFYKKLLEASIIRTAKGEEHDAAPPRDSTETSALLTEAPSCSAPVPSDPRPMPMLSDRYKIIRQVGNGANATVYLGQDCENEQFRALKFYSYFTAKDIAIFQDPTIAKTLQDNPHTNLPLLHSIEKQPDGGMLMVTEFIRGSTLQECCTTTGLTFWMKAQYLTEMCEALIFLHDAGLVYGDLSPANVMADGLQLYLVDYSALRRIGMFADDSTIDVINKSSFFQSPEYRHSNRLYPASDVYSMGRMLQYLLLEQSGSSAPPDHSTDGQAKTLLHRALPKAAIGMLYELIYRATQNDPDKRPSMQQFHSELMGILSRNPDLDDAVLCLSYRRPTE